MTRPKHIIRGCSIDSATGGLVLEFLTPVSDVSSNGMVLNHALLIPPEDQWLPLLDEIESTLQRALNTALEAFRDAPPASAAAAVDDGPAPYDNPEER